jgi:hypothetical protein
MKNNLFHNQQMFCNMCVGIGGEGGCYFMSLSAWAREHDQIFFKYSSHVDKIFK